MPVTLKCRDCGHTEASDDGEPETCPECEGTMAPPAKKKYQAKSTSLEDEEKTKKKSKPKPRDEDEDDAPRPKKKPRGDGGNPRDGAAAERAEIPTGFDDAELVAQVEEELEVGEVLHFACRPARKLAKLQAMLYAGIACIFVLIPGLIGISILSKDKGGEALMGLVPLGVAVAAGVAAVLIPRGRMRQAARGWYAVTDRRAIVFEVPLFGGKGEATAYTPDQLRKMWVQKSAWLKGGGDVVFKTKITITTRVSEKSEKTEKTTTHYGFIGVEHAESVRDVIEWVLLSDERPGRDDE